MTPGRLWAYRLLALALLPLLLLGIAELGLRLAGYGHPTSFFLEFKDSDGVRIIPNDDFGLLFFPPEQTRTPTPLSFRRDKPEGAYRIFLLGESAALGDPRPAYGFGRYLQALLETRFPNGRFEVIPAAMTAINSHALRAVARECRAYQADLWILYVGNNEMGGPFGGRYCVRSQDPAHASHPGQLGPSQHTPRSVVDHDTPSSHPTPGPPPASGADSRCSSNNTNAVSSTSITGITSKRSCAPV